ncbi:MAG: outer membrane protein assembly factor BamE [Alphaproteobacteria bacterium]|nr:outer membrane protein assembly factor BamE [Alphaproteobacteria bacterium]MBU1525856.1 outer membrane protein assembly factor BamE [Alphaproteobacteria bacterium]MBU2350072.1 outer membrane protein assembly factor BamE [Alphaproteobacteria bacterium]MBU2381630.1 outer membrane protein assembly factor BamE [Alphaproteobacteria bacterium]
MYRILTASALGALALTAAACAPVIGSHGYQALEAAPADVAIGTDTKTTVRDRLGTPSATSLFEGEDIWYYISQTTEKYTFNLPQVSQRSVTEIVFEGDKVASVRTLGLEDGRDVAMNRNETPTRGRQLTILEQLLGNVGRGQLPRTDEDAPGQRRPD